MAEKKSQHKQAQEEAREVEARTNKKIESFRKKREVLDKELTEIQSIFDAIRNIPSDKKVKCEELKEVRINCKQFSWLDDIGHVARSGAMAAGQTFFALVVPGLMPMAGIAILTTAVDVWVAKTKKDRINSILISISQRDVESCELAIVEINERINHIVDESVKLRNARLKIKTFGTDYNEMSEEQQYELGSYVNLMSSATQLLVTPIKGLQPKYSSEDFDRFIARYARKADAEMCMKYKDLIVYLANRLYKIDINGRDKILLWETLRKNKEFLELMNMTKEELTLDILAAVYETLEYKYYWEETIKSES